MRASSASASAGFWGEVSFFVGWWLVRPAAVGFWSCGIGATYGGHSCGLVVVLLGSRWGLVGVLFRGARVVVRSMYGFCEWCGEGEGTRDGGREGEWEEGQR